jgi:subtilisin family serine protease
MLKVVVVLLVASALALAPHHQHKEKFTRGVEDEFSAEEISYIVVLNPNAPANTSLGVSAGKIQATYDIAGFFRGFAVWLTDTELMRVRDHRDVSYVEEDTTFSVSPISEGNATELDVDWLTRPDWGQIRVDQSTRNLATTPANLYANGAYADPVSTTWDWNGPKFAPINSAAAVTVYVLDTGIYTAHNEFGGRATVYDVIGGNQAPTGDCNGHGTHCAGSIGGKNRGVATAVRLVGVRVLNCQGSGTTANILTGIQYIVNQHGIRKGVGILSASLGGSFSTSLNDAVNSAANAGVVPVVAAGNSNADAKDYSPASASKAITVGATTSADAIASFSNWGSLINVLSPGSSVHSSYIGSVSTYSSLSGTSMATPLVAGSLALYGQAVGSLTFDTAVAAITKFARSGVVTGLTGAKAATPNKFIYDKWE